VGATSLFGAVESALNRVWGAISRGWFRGRLAVFLSLAAFTVVLLTLLIAIMAILRSLRDSPVGAGLPLAYGPSLLAFVAPPFIIFALFFLAYKFLPHDHVTVRASLLGALAAMVLSELAIGAMAWYIDTIADYSRVYNSAGAVFALLTWLYALASVFLYGAEISATYDSYMSDNEG